MSKHFFIYKHYQQNNTKQVENRQSYTLRLTLKNYYFFYIKYTTLRNCFKGISCSCTLRLNKTFCQRSWPVEVPVYTPLLRGQKG